MMNVLKITAIFLIRVYQHSLGYLIGGHCRFYPSCSEYAMGAIEKHGTVLGGLKGLWRILRCNPFSHGGYDPVK